MVLRCPRQMIDHGSFTGDRREILPSPGQETVNGTSSVCASIDQNDGTDAVQTASSAEAANYVKWLNVDDTSPQI